MGNNGEHMAVERFDASVKTRVPSELKQGLKAIAQRRHLDVADIVREALRELVARELEKASAANDNGNAEIAHATA